MRLVILLGSLALLACSRSPIGAAGATAHPVAVAVAERLVPGMLSGFVLDTTGRSLSDASVTLDNRAVTVTDTAGRFQFDRVPPGEHTIRVRHIGFAAATQTITLDAGTGATFVFRLPTEQVVLESVCALTAGPSVTVKVPSVPGAHLTIAHRDSVERFALDSVQTLTDSNGMRIVGGFEDLPGRFDVVLNAPGYREWRTSVTVKLGSCGGIIRQTVTAELVRER